MSSYEYEKTLIQCSNRLEFQALLKTFEELKFECRLQTVNKRQFFITSDDRVMVLLGSYGKIWSAASCEFGIIQHQPEIVIDFGTCGSLWKDFEIGDWMIARDLLEYDVFRSSDDTETLQQLLVDPGLVDQLKIQLEKHNEKMGTMIEIGRMLCADRDIQTGLERSALAKKFEGQAVCWESMAIAKIAKFHELDFVSFRVISDDGKSNATGKDFLEEYKRNTKKVLPPATLALIESLKELGWV